MKNKFFQLSLVLILFIFLYILLVLIDILLPRIPKILSENYKHSSQIIKDREVKDYAEFKKKKYEKFNAMVFPSNYNYFPLNKIVKKDQFINLSSLSKTDFILCSEGDGISTITTDRFGFRNPDFLWDYEIDTVIIGDSFVEGQCVDYDESLAGRFNKKNIRTISLASGGNSAIHYAFLSKIYLNILRPKNVIIIFHENDNSLVDEHELHSRFFSILDTNDYVSINNNTLKPSKKVELFNSNIKKYLSDKKKFNTFFFNLSVNLSKLKKYFLLTHLREYYNFIFKKNNLFKNSKLAIDEVINYCKIMNCNVNIGLIRSSNYWDPRYFYKNYKYSLQSYLQKYNLTLMDFDKEINFKDNSNYSSKGPHLSVKAYEKIFNKLELYYYNANK